MDHQEYTCIFASCRVLHYVGTYVRNDCPGCGRNGIRQ